ncbi:MAG: ribonucleotide reductase [bacterium]
MAFKEQAKCEKIARTGRVESWMEDPEGRLPVSCAVIVVEDSMEGKDGIEASWRFTSHGLRNGAGVAVHLSKLRPRGEQNGKGLTASGPCSFGKIYSTLNEILRRGGKFKNGAVVLHLDYDHPDAMEFISMERKELQWAKRAINVDEHFFERTSPEFRAKLIQGISNGDVWLVKKKYNAKGERVYFQVCLEVAMPSRGTCLLEHVNLGACKVEDLYNAFRQGMKELCELHARTGVGDTGEYLPPEIDKQVGLGMLGLANFLSIHGISYKDFGDALEALTMDDPHPWCHHWGDQPAGKAASALRDGIDAAAEIAREHKMERAFAIAPTASCSYRYLDLRDFTTAPEIAPPIARLVDRDSETMGVERFDYGPVEIAEEVGWEAFRKVADGIMRLLDNTGLLHGYSMNWWSDLVVCDEDFLKEWLDSPQTSLYYALQVQSGTQAKDDVGVELGESLTSFFGLDDTNEPASCSIDAGFCAACSE